MGHDGTDGHLSRRKLLLRMPGSTAALHVADLGDLAKAAEALVKLRGFETGSVSTWRSPSAGR